MLAACMTSVVHARHGGLQLLSDLHSRGRLLRAHLRIWLLLASALNFACDQIRCLATKTKGKFRRCADVFIKLVHGPGKAVLLCRLRRSLRAISEVCPSSSCKCIQHLKESCSHDASRGKHGWLHAPAHPVEPRPPTLGSGFKRKLLILAPAALDLSANKEACLL